jgi:hypothetical protein
LSFILTVLLQLSTMIKRNYMNPYIAGILPGLVLLAAMFFSGRGLGASGGIKYAVVAAVDAVAPEHAQQSAYYSGYFGNGEKLFKNRLVFEVMRMVLGGFISGALLGMTVLSVAGFVTMMSIFGSAFLFAWLFRKLWI